MRERIISTASGVPRAQPTPARGVKIASGVAAGLLALLALAIWALVKAVAD